MLVSIHLPPASLYFNRALVNSTFGGAYSIESYNCTSSRYLSETGISKLCTESLKATNASNLSEPVSFIIALYLFNSSQSAAGFVQRIPFNLNSTPWPSAVKIESGNLSSEGASVFYSRELLRSAQDYVITTVFIENRSVLFSVTAEGLATTVSNSTLENYTIRLSDALMSSG